MNLNGYAVKDVNMMETPRGISFTGDIYYIDKMIGNAYNSGDGSMTNVSLFREHRDHYHVLDEAFVERLFTINDYESIFTEHMKSNADKGLAFITYANPFDLDTVICGKNETAEDVIAKISGTNPGREIETVEVFRSLDDFIITDRDAAADHPAVYKKEQKRVSEKESVIKKISEAKQNPALPKKAPGHKKQEPEL